MFSDLVKGKAWTFGTELILVNNISDDQKKLSTRISEISDEIMVCSQCFTAGEWKKLFKGMAELIGPFAEVLQFVGEVQG